MSQLKSIHVSCPSAPQSFCHQPALIHSSPYCQERLQVCALQSILQQLFRSVHVFRNSFQTLMKNPGPFLYFTLDAKKMKRRGINQPRPSISSWQLPSRTVKLNLKEPRQLLERVNRIKVIPTPQ